MAHTSQLAMADDAGDARGDPLWRELAGVLLALASHIALLNISDELAMQIALSLAGILVMIAAATLLSSNRIKPRQQLPLG